MYKAGRKSESFSHSFLAVFNLLVMQQIYSFFKKVFYKKKCLRVAGFLQLGALKHDARSEYNRWKSEHSERQ